jgi:hypothetical protein
VAKAFKGLAGKLTGSPSVEEPALNRLCPEHEVFGNGEVRGYG